MKYLMMTGMLMLAASIANADPAMIAQTNKGPTLVDAMGMTLYTFTKDSKDVSVCNGKCAQNWPPLMAANTDQSMGDWSVFVRDDGSMQWAYKGQPLYTWVNDTKPGDTTGDGMAGGTWLVAQP